eukprot:5607924-Prymnesium_polylepis.2
MSTNWERQGGRDESVRNSRASARTATGRHPPAFELARELEDLNPPYVPLESVGRLDAKDPRDCRHALIEADQCLNLEAHPRPLPAPSQIQESLANSAKDRI